MSRRLALPLLLALAGAVAPGQAPATLPARQVVIRAFKPWEDRWTGPHWAFHAPMVVVEGDLVVTSTSDTEDACPGPLAGAAWRLFWRKDGLWRAQAPEALQCQREPCPIARIAPHRMVLFSCPEAAGGGTLPELRIYRLDPVHGPRFERALPVPLPAGARFGPHTYRGLATDPSNESFLITCLDDSVPSKTWWFYGTLKEGFIRQGILPFPDRGCYPVIALHGNRAAVLAIQDIEEPNSEWKSRKLKATGKSWDFVFRRLYLTTNPDITRSPFESARVLDDVSKFGGALLPLDLVQTGNGSLHILYSRQFTTTLMRKLVFPSASDKVSLEYRQYSSSGSLDLQFTASSPDPSEEFNWGRLVTMPQDSVAMIATSIGASSGQRSAKNWVLPITPTLGQMHPLQTNPGLERFFIPNNRSGNAPSASIEMIGSGLYPTILYGLSSSRP